VQNVWKDTIPRQASQQDLPAGETPTGSEPRTTQQQALSPEPPLPSVISGAGLRAGRSGFDSRRRLGICLSTTASRTALGPIQPTIQWVLVVLSLGVKRPGREAYHSPPSRAEFKNPWSYTSTPQYVFMAWCLVKHRDNFTFI
jgi:hypothetical protein